MLSRPLFDSIMRDESLVRGLCDPEARVLIEWLVDRAELLSCQPDALRVERGVRQLCRRGRAICRFVYLWCHQRAHGSAIQLAAVERFSWPLPCDTIDPCLLMQDILNWEDDSSSLAA